MNTLANVLLREFVNKYGDIISKSDVVDYLNWLGDLSGLYRLGCKIYADYLYDWVVDFGI